MNTTKTPESKGNPVGETLVSLMYAADRMHFADDSDLRNYLTVWLGHHLDIAHAKESVKVIRALRGVLEMVYQNPKLVPLYAVNKALVLADEHLALQVPYVPNDVTASPAVALDVEAGEA